MTSILVWVLLSTAAPVPASLPAPVSAAVPTAAVSPVVIVRLGEASLEEYRHGDPQNRVQLLRGSQDEPKP